MSANGMREGAYDPLEDAVLAAMVASGHKGARFAATALDAGPLPVSRLAWGEVPDDAPTTPCLGPLDDVEGNGRGPT